MARLDRLPSKDDQGSWRGGIETPQGGRHKLKYEPGMGGFRVSSTLPAGMNFPFDFGFIPRTRGDDGDPLDILVLMDAPAYPGCLVPVRLLGVMEADQTEKDGTTVRNDRLLAIAHGSTERGELHGLKDLGDGLLTELETFFSTYNQLAGKRFRVRRMRGAGRAAKVIVASSI